MTLQAVRRAVEQPIIDALSLDVPVFVENQLYAENDALTEFVLVRLQFGEIIEPSVGCPPAENLRASLVVEAFTTKGRGPGRAQEIITPVLQVLTSFGGLTPATDDTRVTVSRITGPTFIPLDGRPHLMARVSAALRLRYDGA